MLPQENPLAYTSLAEIYSHKPCLSGWGRAVAHMPHIGVPSQSTDLFLLTDLPKGNTVGDILWIIRKKSPEMCRIVAPKFARLCADSVAHLRDADAAYAAYAADADAYAAAYAADYAAAAAAAAYAADYAAAAAAADYAAAADAAADAADYAADYAADAAAAADADAAADAARLAQQTKNFTFLVDTIKAYLAGAL